LQRYEEILQNDFLADHNISTGSPFHHPHLHIQLEIMLPCVDGVMCRLEHETIPFPKHHLMLLNRGDLHQFIIDPSQSYDRYVFYFSPSFLAALSSPGINLLDCFYLRPNRTPEPLPIPEEELEDFLKLADTLVYYSHADPETVYGAVLYCKAYLIQFLLKINQFYREYHQTQLFSAKDQDDKELVYEMLDYIHSHYQESLSVEDLSARFLISQTRLYHIFRMVAGDSPGNYILRFRVAKAKELLSLGYSVEITGQQCGFTNLSHFSRIFKKTCGISPKQYQKEQLQR